MPDITKLLNQQMHMANVQCMHQDGQVLVFSSHTDQLSRGVLVEDLPAALKFVTSYLQHCRTSGVESVLSYAATSHLPVVNNTVHPQSSWYNNKETLSRVSMVNMLLAARDLDQRAKVSVKDLEVHRWYKKAAATILEGAVSYSNK